MTQPGSEPFAPRPWPDRRLDESPLRALRARVVGRDEGLRGRLAALLGAAGCTLLDESSRDALAPELLLIAADSEQELLTELDARVERALLEPPLVIHVSQRALREPDERVFASVAASTSERELRTLIGRGLEVRELERENRRLRDNLADRFTLGSVVTRDPSMSRILATLESVAETRANVLISGESGTGKTMLARTMHALSPRREGPFVVVNCGALPDNLLESELFGHAKGAFTGAVRDRAGRFEEAHTGTIFLDEIDSASLDMQVKLLHVIQDLRFQRVGESRTREVDTRLVTATNRDLKQEIASGRFREDLYYRIHVVDLHLPPLRERPGDIALLSERIVQRYAREYRREARSLSARCLSALVAHDWPGNVRELENVLERAVLLSTGPRLLAEDLGSELRSGAVEPHQPAGLLAGLDSLARLPLRQALEVPERAILERALEICAGHRGRTARMLELNRSTLFNKMRKYGFLERDFDAAG